MCGRVGLGKEQRYAVDLRYDLVLSRLNGVRYNLKPTQPIPLLRMIDGQPDAVMSQWGLKPHWLKTGQGWFNARGETVHEKNAFKNAFKKRRGIIPASNFYEWLGEKSPKQPYLIERADGATIVFAALWEDGETPTSTIITTAANAFMAPG